MLICWDKGQLALPATLCAPVHTDHTKLLGVPVDVLTPNALPDRCRASVPAEASPIHHDLPGLHTLIQAIKLS